MCFGFTGSVTSIICQPGVARPIGMAGRRLDVEVHVVTGMASVIANEWGESRTPAYSSALIEIGLLLFVMSLFLNLLARLLVWSVSRRNPDQRA